MSVSRVLLVEDDPEIGSELEQALAVHGFAARWATSGAGALGEVVQCPPDLVLLDLGLPDTDGIALCRQLRVALPVAVIVVATARSDELDVVIALDAGADDYLIKPFRLAELLARLRAHLRRQAVGTDDARSVEVGPLHIDVAARRAAVSGRELVLRPKEFDLLLVLAGTAGQVVSREELMAQVWDENWFGPTKTLDVHVSVLRRKLAEAGDDPARISTVRGRGYRYEVSPG